MRLTISAKVPNLEYDDCMPRLGNFVGQISTQPPSDIRNASQYTQGVLRQRHDGSCRRSV